MSRSAVVLTLAIAGLAALIVWSHLRLSARLETIEARVGPPRDPAAFRRILEEKIGGALLASNHEIARAQIGNFVSAIQQFKVINRKLPASLEDLTRKDDANPEPLMDSIPKDPWDNPYEYRPIGNKDFSIRSSGEDGQPDTADDIVWPPK